MKAGSACGVFKRVPGFQNIQSGYVIRLNLDARSGEPRGGTDVDNETGPFQRGGVELQGPRGSFGRNSSYSQVQPHPGDTQMLQASRQQLRLVACNHKSLNRKLVDRW